MARNGITTIQDFLTVEPQDEGFVDTVLSAYAEVGIRVVFAVLVAEPHSARATSVDPEVTAVGSTSHSAATTVAAPRARTPGSRRC